MRTLCHGDYELAWYASSLRTSLAVWRSKTEKQKKFVKFGGTKQNIPYIKSSDSNLLIPKTGTTAKKPGQK
jgi:hypothetical protein